MIILFRIILKENPQIVHCCLSHLNSCSGIFCYVGRGHQLLDKQTLTYPDRDYIHIIIIKITMFQNMLSLSVVGTSLFPCVIDLFYRYSDCIPQPYRHTGLPHAPTCSLYHWNGQFFKFAAGSTNVWCHSCW